jgi:CubicO group peptidase (beta-lactamase class C family)
MMSPLDAVAGWPVDNAAVAVVNPAATADAPLATYGDLHWRTRIASITKILVGYATLIAVEEQSLDLDQPAGPPGSTVRHLLAHTSGLPFRGKAPIAAPGRRRIYSNTGFEVLGEVVTRSTGIPIGDYVTEAVFQPLAMTATELRGSPAYGARSTVADLSRFAGELLAPALIAPATLAEATTEQFPGLSGVIPGLGRYRPNPWGLSFELKGSKTPHWTAPEGSPRTFGHFGGTGTCLWVDPDARIACVLIVDRQFGPWAVPLWSKLASGILGQFTAEARTPQQPAATPPPRARTTRQG